MSDKNSSSQNLSNLEFLVLGVIWRDGPCTAYRIRQEFAESPNSFWSGSQGAIYPLLRKLESCKLIDVRANTDDKRKTKLVSINRAGKRKLISWYDISRPTELLLQEYDSIRTQLFFIKVLPVSKSKKYLDNLMHLLREQEIELVARIENCDSSQLLYQIAWKGVLATNKARQEWLADARQQLDL